MTEAADLIRSMAEQGMAADAICASLAERGVRNARRRPYLVPEVEAFLRIQGIAPSLVSDQAQSVLHLKSAAAVTGALTRNMAPKHAAAPPVPAPARARDARWPRSLDYSPDELDLRY